MLYNITFKPEFLTEIVLTKLKKCRKSPRSGKPTAGMGSNCSSPSQKWFVWTPLPPGQVRFGTIFYM
ncbi:hypothetical protein D3C76_1661660 [compost metagenome]